MTNTKPVIGAVCMPIEYENVVKGIKLVLRNRYKLTVSEAEAAVSLSPVKQIFEMDAEMAAHTSNEAWARDIYQFWLKHNQ